MKLIAHRGYKTKFIKENTEEAFTNALNHKFVGIELDVRKTKDNQLVVCHNAFINAVSDGKGLLKDFTYDELLQFNFGTMEYKSKIPLLKDIMFKYDCIKVIELKEKIDFDSIVNYIDTNTYFISFNTSYILKLKEKYPKCKFGSLNYVLNSIDNYNLDAICLLDQIATNNIVNSFLNRGIKVFIYGVGHNINYTNDNEDIFYIVDKMY